MLDARPRTVRRIQTPTQHAHRMAEHVQQWPAHGLRRHGRRDLDPASKARNSGPARDACAANRARIAFRAENNQPITHRHCVRPSLFQRFHARGRNCGKAS